DALAALGAALGEHRPAVAALLAEPLADGLTRGEALRWGALLHDAAKVLTRVRASERLRGHVAALVRNHLRLGFLVHEPQPISRRTVFEYMRATEPVEVDVTLLSVADRLATRGDRAEQAIAAHLAVAEDMLGHALGWRAEGPPAPLLRGDELARELGIAPGPRLGELLERLAQAQFAGEVATREQALAHARALA